ncbi:MAG: hypothetical protein C0424_05415 [Sphingobacteriaceae bacterium]|nr:hypothetical protein [Sphingobacteriaceae bacterium]
MGRPWIYALILITSLRVTGVKAGDSLQLLRSYALEQPVRYFTADHLGNFYLITRSNELVKYDVNGQWVGNYRQQVLGPLENVDVFNPLQLLLFYPELATLVQLDNMLYPTNRFQLEAVRLGTRSLVCRSFDNNFWLYDERAFRLRKMALDLRQVVEGEWLQNQFKGPLKPNYLIEHNEQLYLNEPALGILVFDLYGKYLRTLPIKGIDRLDAHGEYLYYLRNGTVWRWKLPTGEEEPLVYAGAQAIRQIKVTSYGHYLLTRTALLHYGHKDAGNR